MADNYTYTPGTGGIGGADEIAGVSYQRIKIIHGIDGTNDGDVAASNPLPVTISGVATATNQATTNTSLATLVTNTPALDNSKSPVIPSMTTGGNLSVQTAATGTNWTAFASQACKQLVISNQTGVTLEVRQGGAGVAVQVFSPSYFPFYGLTNANQLEVRRFDTSNTQVTATARWES